MNKIIQHLYNNPHLIDGNAILYPIHHNLAAFAFLHHNGKLVTGFLRRENNLAPNITTQTIRDTLDQDKIIENNLSKTIILREDTNAIHNPDKLIRFMIYKLKLTLSYTHLFQQPSAGA